jgi:hypothetical protein
VVFATDLLVVFNEDLVEVLVVVDVLISFVVELELSRPKTIATGMATIKVTQITKVINFIKTTVLLFLATFLFITGFDETRIE